MTTSQYIECLKALDLRSLESIEGFSYKTCYRWHEKPAKPITLGSGNGNVYQFQSAYVEDTYKEDLNNKASQLHYIAKLVPTIPGATSSLQFILPLGTLHCIPKSWGKNGPPGVCYQQFEESCDGTRLGSPYFVALNMVDRSIWIVLASYYVDYMSFEYQISAEEDTWKFLHTESKGRESFDVMRIMSWEEFLAIGTTSGFKAETRAFFNKASLDSARRIGPKQLAVTRDEVEKAMERTSALSLSSAKSCCGTKSKDKNAEAATEKDLDDSSKVDSAITDIAIQQVDSTELSNTSSGSPNTHEEKEDAQKLDDTDGGMGVKSGPKDKREHEAVESNACQTNDSADRYCTPLERSPFSPAAGGRWNARVYAH